MQRKNSAAQMLKRCFLLLAVNYPVSGQVRKEQRLADWHRRYEYLKGGCPALSRYQPPDHLSISYSININFLDFQSVNPTSLP